MDTHYMRGFGRQFLHILNAKLKKKKKRSNINVSINKTRTLIPSSFIFYI